MRISVFGLGYVGRSRPRRWPPTAMMSSASTSTTTRLRPQRGRSPIVEPGLDALLRGRREGRLRATTDTADAVGHRTCRSSASARRAAERQPGSHLSRARLRADRRRRCGQDRLSRRGHPQHGAARDDTRRRHSGARAASRARSTARDSASPSIQSSCARARRSRISASRR